SRPFLRSGFSVGELSKQFDGIRVRNIADAPFNLGARACEKLREDFEIGLHRLFDKKTRNRGTLAKLTVQLLVYGVSQLDDFTPLQPSGRIYNFHLPHRVSADL